MKPQQPAEGIMLTKDFGDTRMYNVACDCGSPEHQHSVNVTAEEIGVTVEISVECTTDFWSTAVANRYDIDNNMLQRLDWYWKGIWNSIIRKVQLTYSIWVHEKVKYEAYIILTEQQALNYAEVLKSASKDVAEYRKNYEQN